MGQQEERVVRLTREQIGCIRTIVDGGLSASADEVRALCDLALQALGEAEPLQLRGDCTSFLAEQCNRLQGRECRLVRCLRRSGYVIGSGGFEGRGTCESFEIAEALTRRARPQGQGWIAVSESLPARDTSIQVLVLTVSGRMRVEHAVEVVGLFNDAKRCGEECNITHWQPLPDLPTPLGAAR